MRQLIYIITFFFMAVSCNSQNKVAEYSVNKSESEWKDVLTPEQYNVLRQSGTERPFTGEYNKHYKKGTYTCAGCNTPLYKSEHKFDSGTGWPSFDRAIPESILIGVDYKLGYSRNELKCSTCGGHLGHVFGDGPSETTGKRHCINSVSLKFINQTNE